MRLSGAELAYFYSGRGKWIAPTMEMQGMQGFRAVMITVLLSGWMTGCGTAPVDASLPIEGDPEYVKDGLQRNLADQLVDDTPNCKNEEFRQKYVAECTVLNASYTGSEVEEFARIKTDLDLFKTQLSEDLNKMEDSQTYWGPVVPICDFSDGLDQPVNSFLELESLTDGWLRVNAYCYQVRDRILIGSIEYRRFQGLQTLYEMGQNGKEDSSFFRAVEETLAEKDSL